MIQKLSHTPVFVLDQERAKEFYTQKLGFEVRADETLGTFRWLTVGPKTQPEVEIILMPIASSPMLDGDSAAALRRLVESGKMGAAVFATNDCRKTYEELKGRGVTFRQEPAERPYG